MHTAFTNAGSVHGEFINCAAVGIWKEDRLPGLAANLLRRQVAAILGPAFRWRRQAKPQRRRSYSSLEPTQSELSRPKINRFTRCPGSRARGFVGGPRQ